jgi:hypothetical protein
VLFYGGWLARVTFQKQRAAGRMHRQQIGIDRIRALAGEDG